MLGKKAYLCAGDQPSLQEAYVFLGHMRGWLVETMDARVLVGS